MACSVLLSCSAVAWADNWPSWRGPENNGICKETKVPVKWDANTNIAWKLAMPAKDMGGSTPAVWDKHMFLPVVEGKDIMFLCVDTDGKVVWKRKLGAAGANRIKFKADESNQASNSATTDGKHVWIMDGAGDFVCFDFDGNEVWRFDVQQRYGKFDTFHGLHNSPLLHGNVLYLSLLSHGGQWVVAIDKATGKDVWKINRKTSAKGENVDSYVSPIIWHNGKETCLVVLGADNVTGHRLTDGSELWRYGTNSKRTDDRLISCPIASGDLLVACTGRGGGSITAFKPGASGTIKAGGEFVQWQNAKGSPDVPSMLIHDGLLYVAKAESGALTCLDLKTGKALYSDQRLHGGRYRASPVYANGNIYVTARDEGYVTVVKAGPKFEVVADNKLADTFSASPAFSNGRMYLRGYKYLYAIDAGGK